jgi:ABC-2 type transport system permease protein
VALDQLLGKTRFATFPFLPSYQLTAGILHWSEGTLGPAAFYMTVLLSSTLFFGTLAFTRLGGLFYESASLVQGRTVNPGQWRWLWPGRPRRQGLIGPGRLHRLLSRTPGLPPETAALLYKDTLLFWRDTTQWGQTVMLFGLLAAYILNLRHFTHQLTSVFWLHLVSYLNLGTCSLTLATLTTRFVFPQFSLEGQRLWIIGLAPMGLERVVRIKYWLASITSLAITLALVMLSCHLLKLPGRQMALFAAAVTLMTLALNGLAVGLGVLYPNFRDPNASKIVSGFGGTLCLVLSFVYILVGVLLLAMGSGGFQLPPAWSFWALAGFGLLSLLTAVLPLRAARRRLLRLEV